jgi:hypothetical protein
MEEKMLRIGQHVVFIDEHRRERDALLVAIHGDPQGRLCLGTKKNEQGEDVTDENGILVADYGEPGTNWPCVNLVVVGDKEEAQDQYGRQIDRPSSVVHWTDSSAHGYCWRFRDEVIDAEMGRTIS